MKFARLKLHGFKSFCDLTELEFRPGLTGVVGPNGCGKSNLVEALRWVMGESSYKAMRASGMDDVIFSGSANRPGRNSAEVTVVLDNSARTAPAHLNTADVLEITRRIERDSGSIYRVNGKEVRARDVQLLFADASTGAHSPALVRQGQIGELIAAKPQQRRALLEEAAGISGLHSRRHEAELRLRAAEQNLERIDDIIAQVEQQLDTLKRQARLAARYKALSGDIRQAEALLFHLRWVAARVAEKEAEAAAAKVIRQLADAEHLDLEAQKVHFLADKAVGPAREREASTGAALQRLVIAREQAETAERDLIRRRDELARHRETILADRAREEGIATEATASIATLSAEIDALRAETAGSSEGIAAAEQAFDRANEAAATAEAVLRHAAEAMAALRAERAAEQRERSEAAERLAKLERQLADLDAQAAALDRQRAEAGDGTETRTALASALAELDALESALAAAGQAIASADQQAEQARISQQTADGEVARLETEIKTLERLVAGAHRPSGTPVLDQLIVSKGYELALGSALGDDLDIGLDPEAALRWTDTGLPEDDPSLPDGVAPLSDFVSGVPALARRLRQIGVTDRETANRLYPLLSPGQRLVSQDGAVWRWDGLLVLAAAPGAQAIRLEQRNRLAELGAMLAPARAARDLARNAFAAAQAALSASRAEDRRLREAVRDAQATAQKARMALDARDRADAALLARREGITSARDSLGAAHREALEALDRLPTRADSDTAEASAAGTLAAAEAQLAERRAAAATARSELQRLVADREQRRSRLDRLEVEVAAATRRRDSARQQITALGTREAEVAAQLAALESDPDARAERERALNSEIATAEAAHRAATDALALAETRRRDAEKALRLASEGLAGLRAEAARLDERQKGFVAQRQQLEKQVIEALGISAHDTARLAGLRPEQELPHEPQVEERVNRLKAERERLGGVNLAAEEESEEVREKLDIMVQDRDDLIAAISALRSGIQNLNREGRQRLGEAFEKVNGHFKELFTSLFGGGTAELQFVDSDDPLEAGLEIIARPPGKKPTTMTLLSGGEQALTAMSLIFAVFLTNPAPICVLDEVDAPLDDANVERFCGLLSTMTTKTETRFLVITHNPITMARVDRLYGVTMAEKGVSQLVSVDLEAAERVRMAS